MPLNSQPASSFVKPFAKTIKTSRETTTFVGATIDQSLLDGHLPFLLFSRFLVVFLALVFDAAKICMALGFWGLPTQLFTMVF